MEEHEREKPEKTPEELAEIAYLDKLRTCEGEEMPVGLPLACVVKVIERVGERFWMEAEHLPKMV